MDTKQREWSKWFRDEVLKTMKSIPRATTFTAPVFPRTDGEQVFWPVDFKDEKGNVVATTTLSRNM